MATTVCTYADGKESGYSRIEKMVSFCLAYDLSREEEIQLFRDINDNQKRMNTSHLDGIVVRLNSRRRIETPNSGALHRPAAKP